MSIQPEDQTMSVTSPHDAYPADALPSHADPAETYPVDAYPVDAYPVDAVPGHDAVSASPSGPRADEEWAALQLRFVDDPAETVRAAADRVQRELAAARSQLESADTEGLRTAFRRFRELSDALR